MTAGGMSRANVSSWACSTAGGVASMCVTSVVLCAVMPATTVQQCTWKASAARWSAARPAPPPLSVPAMLQMMGGVVVCMVCEVKTPFALSLSMGSQGLRPFDKLRTGQAQPERVLWFSRSGRGVR